MNYIETNYQDFNLESIVLAILTSAAYENNINSKCISYLLKKAMSDLFGQKDVLKIPMNLSSQLIDLKLLIDSKIYPFPPECQETLSNLAKHLAGYQRWNLLNENLPAKNPIIYDFIKLIEKNLGSEALFQEAANFDFIKNGANYKPQLFATAQSKDKKFLKQAIFLFDSNHASIENASLKEIWKLRFKILEGLIPSLKCQGISSSILYDIDMNNQQIHLKSEVQLEEIAASIIRSGNPFDDLKKLRSYAKILQTFYKKNKEEFYHLKSHSALKKMVSYLSEIFEIIGKIKFSPNEGMTTYYLEKSKYIIYLTWKAAKILDHKLRKKLLKKVNTEFKQKFVSLEDFHRFLNEDFEINSTKENYQNVHEKLKNFPWIGKRFSNEILNLQKNDKKNINYELLDMGFYGDLSYHNYPGWKERFEDLSLKNFFFIKPQIFSNRLFSSNFDVRQNQIIGAIPQARRIKKFIKPMSYKFLWEPQMLHNHENELNKAKKFETLAYISSEESSKDLKFMINLQNFKYVLKKEMTVDEVAKLLVDFKFIDELIEEHLKIRKRKYPKSNRKFIRNTKDYIRYANHPFRGAMINEYTKFMFKVAFRKEKLRHNIKMRNSLELYKVIDLLVVY